ncbi:NAD(P)/FAD-dependent oxidoreductase [Defluviimonas sp. WL0024]|uniref:NAD(P)/FAD-dependent oxidoreductase n=1 Tax=Albidovulum salinarum TaxID=2984153 RepID=A0ABT2X830_9RHOB|nr:NAD(P)/FAD-dependent oxidoreductase [Defluviimonas sp. WL0024]MCU9850101.1 NAD(P)/FAD-dependent oxidoreductase [Defluviimonas sp. WL0024]
MTRDFGNTAYDAIIVGARCAGASTAMLLARRGAKVLVVDHDQPGTDTMSTHALMRAGVFQLRKWGLLHAIVGAGTPAVRRTSFIYDGEALDIDLKDEEGIAALYAPRRTLLDVTLAEAAAVAGAELRYGTGFTGFITDDQGRVIGAKVRTPSGIIREVRAPLVIGADGRRSSVARAAGAQVTRTAQNTISCLYQYVRGLPNRGYRWHFAPGAAGGVIPTNDGLSCVFVGLPPELQAEVRKAGPQNLEKIASRFVPALADDLAGADATSVPVLFSGLPGFFRQSAGPGWALVGDAGYFRDPISAHGISDALRDAEILADAVIAGTLVDYPALRDSLSSEFFALTDRLAGLDWTMGEVQNIHLDLNRSMKANQRWVAGFKRELPTAA